MTGITRRIALAAAVAGLSMSAGMGGAEVIERPHHSDPSFDPGTRMRRYRGDGHTPPKHSVFARKKRLRKISRASRRANLRGRALHGKGVSR